MNSVSCPAGCWMDVYQVPPLALLWAGSQPPRPPQVSRAGETRQRVFPKAAKCTVWEGVHLGLGCAWLIGLLHDYPSEKQPKQGERLNTCWALQGAQLPAAPFIPQWLVALLLCLYVEDLLGGYMPDGLQKVMISHNPGSWEKSFSRDRAGWNRSKAWLSHLSPCCVVLPSSTPCARGHLHIGIQFVFP